MTKKQSRAATNYAILIGRLTRQPCAVCSSPDVEAHHEDYDKPLDVVWLCKRHHEARHIDDAPRGEQIAMSKLTEETAVYAMARLLAGEKRTSIAKSFRVSKSTINHLWSGYTWSHIFRLKA